MAASRKSAHEAWTQAFARDLRQWMRDNGIRYLDLAQTLGYKSTSVILYHLQRGVGQAFAARLALHYPDRWGTLPADLQSVLYGDAPAAAVSPEVSEAIHALKEGQAALAAGIEALERALTRTDEVDGQIEGNQGSGGGDPGGEPVDRPGDGAARRRAGGRSAGAKKLHRSCTARGRFVSGAPERI